MQLVERRFGASAMLVLVGTIYSWCHTICLDVAELGLGSAGGELRHNGENTVNDYSRRLFGHQLLMSVGYHYWPQTLM